MPGIRLSPEQALLQCYSRIRDLRLAPWLHIKITKGAFKKYQLLDSPKAIKSASLEGVAVHCYFLKALMWLLNAVEVNNQCHYGKDLTIQRWRLSLILSPSPDTQSVGIHIREDASVCFLIECGQQHHSNSFPKKVSGQPVEAMLSALSPDAPRKKDLHNEARNCALEPLLSVQSNFSSVVTHTMDHMQAHDTVLLWYPGKTQFPAEFLC